MRLVHGLLVLSYLLSLTSLGTLIYVLLRQSRVRRHARRREDQLIDLCKVQQRWIARGELACPTCPGLGRCVIHGRCREEAALAAAWPAQAPQSRVM